MLRSTWYFSARLCASLALVSSTLGAGGLAYAEDGVSESTILLGQTVGLTGQIAGPVKEMNAGANAYFAYINKNGGVNGRKIEVRTLDDKFEPALAAGNAGTLIKTEHVFALFQSRGTPHTEALLPLLAENKIPLIAPSTGATLFHTPNNRYVFNVRAKYRDEVTRGVEQFNTVGIKEIGVLHVDDSFGNDGLIGFNHAMAKYNLTPAIVFKYDRTKPDVAAVVATLNQSKAKALIIVGSATTTVDIIKAVRAQGNAVQIMTLSNNSSQSFVEALGKASAGIIVSQIMPAPNSTSTKLGQEFKEIAAPQGVNSSYASMEGFVGAKVMVEALRRAGRNLTRDSLIRALESMRRFDLGGVVLSYTDQNHSGSEFVELTIISKDGKFLR
ncbi:ABC transporter substrate-binding protein [Undibacterium sp. RTI2.1]|uniref:ABC transporter substrate-binding protein n=1 Tax=unclassified Undibacterium TaxID=2630295 RepID=UPI002AB547CC|nr:MULTISPECIES: ABC transporter substrate-binding protein [unclassified Undibacterium]MDY7540572.1 ABC transporter substrate-binding protein [Undibacterium sp. 5I1]MEB0029764.1 ABC transporter substrate-binding protein [Undibacterium sp. RTI2.1]MEB0118128.1 ABC transporter substrate-binding protein [Undibacterium sp. RTI2.2]MEB0231235.1 ABC transporter substrate-binding protein [Undibacterium sp. 10I3]MEB0256538.1 ABC transporter substrate-binding protein [Undibacterium sp. 5I1]